MTLSNSAEHHETVRIEIEANLAYEFLMTLCVFSRFENHETHEVGREWFETIQAKISPSFLAALEPFRMEHEGIWEHLFGLVYECPAPRSVPAFLTYLETIESLELLLNVLGYYQRLHRRMTAPTIILQAAQGNREAQKSLLRTSFPEDTYWQKTLCHLFTRSKEEVKRELLNLLTCWYDEIFREREPQVIPIIERDAEAKRALKPIMTPEQLVEIATRGWEYVPEVGIRHILLVPSFILRPWVASSEYHSTRIFCYPVAEESLTSDSNTPPAQLLKIAKALADERRLRILRKLATGSYTLQELADSFEVAKSTMHHHVIALRSTGLVRMRMSDKRYSLRREVVENMSQLLNAYLNDTDCS